MGKGTPALLRFCAAVYGLAIAISLYPLLLRPAPPHQAVGFASAHNIDANASYLFAAALILLPSAAPLVLAPLLRLIGESGSHRWTYNGTAAAMVIAPWSAMIGLSVGWVAAPTLAVTGVSAAMRHIDAGFSRRDLILLPTVATVWIALMDWNMVFHQALVIAMATVFALRIGLVLIRGAFLPSLCFALSPLGLALQSQFVNVGLRQNPWPPMILAIGLPPLLRLFAPDTPSIRGAVSRLLTLLVYPAACIAYVSILSMPGPEEKPRVNFFEDSQHLVAASEMIRGEKPYRDIIPAHGFIQDAGLDAFLLRSGASSIGSILRIRGVIETAGSVVQYAIAAIATGVPEVGLAAAFLATFFGTSGSTIRLLPSLTALALLLWGIRSRSQAGFALAGASAAFALLTSLDLGAYAVLTITIVLVRARTWRSTRAALSGGIIVAAVAGSAFAIYGIARNALRVTLFEIATLGPVYNIGPFTAPEGFRRWSQFPEVLLAVFEKTSFLYVLYAGIILFIAVTFVGRSSRRSDPLLAIAIWCALCGISYAERHHLYWRFAIAPLLAAAIWSGFRSRYRWSRPLAATSVFLLIIIAQPITHIAVVALLRHPATPPDSAWVEVNDLPRARGALFQRNDAILVESVKQFVDAKIRNGETFFDFTNRGLLYFLFDIDCPIRQIEVAFYEPDSLQREVIATLEHNRRVCAALVPADPADTTAVDGVPNQIRAPLVWAYLQRNFTPGFREGDVVFWIRK